MRRFVAALLVAAVVAGRPNRGKGEDPARADEPAATADQPLESESGPLAPPDPSGPAATVQPPAVSADGTTSVVVPTVETEPVPAGDAPAEPPSASASRTPPSAPTPPPPGGAAAGPPAASSPSLAPPPPSAPLPMEGNAAALLSSLLEPFGVPSGGPLPPAYARPLPLLEALARSGDRTRRLWIVQAYWKVATAHAGMRCATAALERLELVAPGSDPHDRATLDVAVAAARADLADANARLGVAQQDLVDLARLPLGEPPPWPIDRPLADPYETRFEEIFASRIATGRVRAIVRTLPARYEALSARAVAVTAADRAMQMAEADHAKGNRPIEAVVAAHSAVVDQQSAFLESVRAYNVEIAEYAMAVADLSTPDEQFVAMLIANPAGWQPRPVEALGPPPAAAGFPSVTLPAQAEALPGGAGVIQVE
jgi:hypothetical protein